MGDFFKALMSDSPLREAVEECFYHRRRGRVEDALREEAQRDPYSVALSDVGATLPRSKVPALEIGDNVGMPASRSDTTQMQQLPLVPPMVPPAVPINQRRVRAVI